MNIDLLEVSLRLAEFGYNPEEIYANLCNVSLDWHYKPISFGWPKWKQYRYIDTLKTDDGNKIYEWAAMRRSDIYFKKKNGFSKGLKDFYNYLLSVDMLSH